MTDHENPLAALATYVPEGLTFQCGDAPECHDETTPCRCGLPAWFLAAMDRPSFGLSPFTVGSMYDAPGADLQVADHLEALGWTVVRQEAAIPAGALLDGWPHPMAGQTYTWAKATPPAYDRHADPVMAATAAAVERTGNSDGLGRGADPWAPAIPTPWQDLLDAVERGDLLPPF